MARRVLALTGALMLMMLGVRAAEPANFTSQAMQEGYDAAVAAAGKPHLNYSIVPTERPLLDSMAEQGRWVPRVARACHGRCRPRRRH